MTPRLPIPGSDDNKWGDILNDFLNVEHNADGSLKRKADIDAAANAVRTVNGKTGSTVTLAAGDIGLGSVDNTSDANKPVSSAAQTALDTKAAKGITITAGYGLTGGGDLSANRSLAVDAATLAGAVAGGGPVLGEFSLPGVAATGYIAAPGFVAWQAITIASVDVRAFFPPLGGTLQVKIWKFSSGTSSSLGTVTLSALSRRVVLGSLNASLSVGDEIRPEIIGVGGTYAGGAGLLVSLLGSAVSVPSVAAAPTGMGSLTATGAAGSVALSWSSVTNASEYLVTRNGLPLAFTPSTSYTDTTGVAGTTYTYGVGAANADAVSAISTASAASLVGVYYTGAQITSGAYWAPTIGANSTLTTNGSSSIWTTGMTGGGASDLAYTVRTAGESGGVAASILHTQVNMLMKWDNTGGGFRIWTRRNGAAYTQAVAAYIYYGTVKIQRKRVADGALTDIASGTFTVTTSHDMWVEVIDDPANSKLDIRIWDSVSGSRPSTATLTVTDATINSASIPAGNVAVQNLSFTGNTSSAYVTEVRSVQIQDLG